MPKIQARCPSKSCGKALRFNVKDGVSRVKGNCPSCRTELAITLTKVARPAPPPDEDEGGAYGLAREDSLTYLLRREEDGFKLSAEEREAKFRLIDDKFRDDPDHCPACEERMPRRAVVCVKCGLDVEKGKRLRTVVDRGEPAKAVSGGGGIIVVDGDAVEDVAESIFEIIVSLAENL